MSAGANAMMPSVLQPLKKKKVLKPSVRNTIMTYTTRRRRKSSGQRSSRSSSVSTASSKSVMIPLNEQAINAKDDDERKENEGKKTEYSENEDEANEKEVSGNSNEMEEEEESGEPNERKGKEESKEEDGNDDTDSDDDEKEDGVYVVERIDGKKITDGKTFYCIKWKGWDESANTWEPVEHLHCPELLEDYEKREAEREKVRKSDNRSNSKKGSKSRRKEQDSDDEYNSVGELRQYMRSYGIHPRWPADKEPLSVEGMIQVDGELVYVVRRNARLASKHLDRTNVVLVKASGFRESYPQLVIQFFQSRIMWSDNDKDDSERANVAAQISLLRQNKGSRVESEIMKEIEQEAKSQNADVLDIVEPDQPGGITATGPESVSTSANFEQRSNPTTQKFHEMETQPIDVYHADSSMEVDEPEAADSRDISAASGVEKPGPDKFGLPPTDDSSSSSDSEGYEDAKEFEEIKISSQDELAPAN